MLPMAATPRAPPTWRVVSLTAEPTPAFSRGSEPITLSVAGAMVRPMPTDITHMLRMTRRYDESAEMNDRANSDPAMTSRPVVTTRLVPTRSTSRADSGAVSIRAAAYGTSRTPAWMGE